MANAQVSDSLYSQLPDTLKPKSRNAITDGERYNIIINVSQATVQKNYAEFKGWIPGLEARMNAATPDIEKVPYASTIADIYLQTGEYSGEFLWFNKLVAFGKSLQKYQHEVCYAYMNLSIMYSSWQKLDSAVDMLHEALDIGEKFNFDDVKKDAHYLYMGIYANIGLNTDAISHANQFLALFTPAEKWNDNYTSTVLVKTACMTNLYRDEKNVQYADSVKILMQDLLQAKKNEASTWYGITYDHLAYLIYLEGNYSQAAVLFDSSLKATYAQPGAYLSELRYRTILYRSLALIALGHNEAILQSLKVDVPKNDFSSLSARNQAIYSYYKKQGDDKKALAYYVSYKANLDSLNLLGQKSKVFELGQKYSVAKKEIAIADLEKKNLRQRNARNITILSAIVALLTVGMLAFWRIRKQKEKQFIEREKLMSELHAMEHDMAVKNAGFDKEKEEVANAQRREISKNMHDEISSSLAALRYLIGDAKRTTDDEKMKNVLQGLEDEALSVYVQARQFMHQLHNSSKTQAYNVTDLLDGLPLKFNKPGNLQVIVNANSDEIDSLFTPQQHAELYKVIKEALTNSLKHSGANEITITITKHNKTFYFDIADNGKGAYKETDTGLGLITMKQRIAGLGGQLVIEPSAQGLHIKGDFPVAQAS